MRGLSLVAASGGHSSSRCAGLSPSRPPLLRSTDSRRAGSVGVAHGPSHSVACGILPDQGSNPCPLHWQADSQPLRHQGSPQGIFSKVAKASGSACFIRALLARVIGLCRGGLWEAVLWNLSWAVFMPICDEIFMRTLGEIPDFGVRISPEELVCFYILDTQLCDSSHLSDDC